eukprot:scaffold15295_cov2127-Ochromonas_danica.AAC.1
MRAQQASINSLLPTPIYPTNLQEAMATANNYLNTIGARAMRTGGGNAITAVAYKTTTFTKRSSDQPPNNTQGNNKKRVNNKKPSSSPKYCSRCDRRGHTLEECWFNNQESNKPSATPKSGATSDNSQGTSRRPFNKSRPNKSNVRAKVMHALVKDDDEDNAPAIAFMAHQEDLQGEDKDDPTPGKR